jgi:hypothetical protein
MTGHQNRNRSRAAGGQHALVIALNYRGSPAELGGCEVDGANMARFFAAQGYDVTTLSASRAAALGPEEGADFQPTRRNIAAAIRRLAATPGLRSAAIFYAGHGSQLRDQTREEADGLDECLVCQSPIGSHGMPGMGDMYRDDDLLADIRAGFSRLDVDLFLMFDACHSGTMCDLGTELTRRGAWQPVAGGYTRVPGELYRVVCMSAAQDKEVALEAGSGGGMMTNKFLMAAARGDLSLRAFNQEFATMGFQCPQISVAQPTSLESIFGGSIIVATVAGRAPPHMQETPQLGRRARLMARARALVAS